MYIIAKIVYVIVASVLFVGSVACEPVSGDDNSGQAAGYPDGQQQIPVPQPEPETNP